MPSYIHKWSDQHSFRANHSPDDDRLIQSWLASSWRANLDRSVVDQTAKKLVEGIRAEAGSVGGLEDFLRDYGLTTKEGLALMVMAEALLRVPDAATQQALINEKIGAGNWSEQTREADTWFVSAATWGLGLSSRIIKPGERPDTVLAGMVRRIGKPAVRTGVKHAMTFLGHQFVLGETIEDALRRAAPNVSRGYLYSFDMLGEGARDWASAVRYRQSYANAIAAIGDRATGADPTDRPGISIKLSALHPSYHARNRSAVLAELVPILADLAHEAARHDLNLTIDAEEADRLEISIDVLEALLERENFGEWAGLGLAVQAYQKRATALIDYLADMARRHKRRLMVRLVKGAYWDGEIKHAQLEGLDDFPVFTRKAATDVSYHQCAAQLLASEGALYPQFATHNALTVATILELAHGRRDFEFQRLHGMGEDLYDQITRGIAGHAPARCRVYAPVGGHKDLLAYLVRRLLENGANSSFVAKVTDKSIPIADLLAHPGDQVAKQARHSRIKSPPDLFSDRENSAGINFGSLERIARLDGAIASRVDVATIPETDIAAVPDLMAKSAAAFPEWAQTPAPDRAFVLERAADLLEERCDDILALLAREAGKTVDDGIAELREAVDFCRYYAEEARHIFDPRELPGPVGERNVYTLRGRGVFLCISPWNFPLAIFLGQVSAALAAGNCVIAKPAVQTPAIAQLAVDILHEAGVPEHAVQLAIGGAKVGEALTAHPNIAGVAFTGSTEVAKAINLQLAQKDGPIVPLIAETGGLNAMIVDATALPEQVCDDVIKSAFRSAGQRCSALRILYLQDDIYEHFLTLIEGAARCLRLGDPADPATDIGPIIDADALSRLQAYLVENRRHIRFSGEAPEEGTFLAPHILELGAHETLEREVFGPMLHVKRFEAGTLDAVIDEINATGYGLTFGLHSRIDAVTERASKRSQAGNVYINRDTIGAIVGSQPFGGSGLSGTGPKAGGPLYLPRFAQEVVVSTDTTAAGGNASLIALDDPGDAYQ